MTIHDLDTPALVIDLDIMERNLQRMADYARAHQLRLRPHTKTHKIPALGRRQVELGAVGLTVAKPGEAEVMLASGTPDLLVAFPTIGARKMERLRGVAAKTRLSVSLDSEVAARALSDGGVTAGVLVEIDAGLGRVGVDPGAAAVELAKVVSRLPGLTFDGIAFYPGQFKNAGESEMAALETGVGAALESTLDGLKNAGLEAKVVSGGSTPTWAHSHRVAGMNEIRPGTYIFNDRNCVGAGSCTWDDCAGSIITTVVSTARPGQVIVDGGSKTLSSDRLSNSSEVSFGRLTSDPQALFHKMNEEHGFVDIRSSSREFKIGDRLRWIPNHICVCMNLHEQVYGVRGEQVEVTWKVEGRGKLQ